MARRRGGLSRPPDVLVVGAGPAGLTTALQAHDHGASVRVVERRIDPFRPSRAMIMHPRTMESLRPLGVTDELLERGDISPRAELHLGRKRVSAELAALDMPETAFPHLTMLRQMDVEEVLAGALEQRGVTVERMEGTVGPDDVPPAEQPALEEAVVAFLRARPLDLGPGGGHPSTAVGEGDADPPFAQDFDRLGQCRVSRYRRHLAALALQDHGDGHPASPLASRTLRLIFPTRRSQREAMPSPDRLPNPRLVALRRYRRIMQWLALLAIFIAGIAVLLVARGDEGRHIHLLVATALGVGLTVLLVTGLMTLSVVSASSGHDEEAARAPDEEKR